MRKAFLALFFLIPGALLIPAASLTSGLFLISGPALVAQQQLNNDAIIKLTKAGLTDDLIITTINANPGTYDTTTDGLIALKKAKVSDKVVSALVMKASGAAGSAAAPAAGTANFTGGGFNATATSGAPTTGPNGLPIGIDDVGVYYKDKTGAWVSLLPEIVNFESGGKFKNIASAGIVKGNLNGHLEGSRSRLNATLPVVFAVYLPETIEITQYQLVHLHPTADAREFLSAAGGVLHTNAGAMRDEIDFQPVKMAPRLYQVTLPESAGHGEFGLLAPGTSNASNKETNAKIYTVSVAN
jgi:hypothetical protein